MNSPLPLAVASLLFPAVVAAQTPLQVSGFPDPTSEPSWGQETSEQQVAIRYDQPAGEYTVFLIHTCPDETVAGTVVARAIATALPFMELPKPTWSFASPELAALTATFDYGDLQANPTEQLMIPPRRVANFLQAFVASNYSLDYGTYSATAVSKYELQEGDVVPPPSWASLAPWDERIPFGVCQWSEGTNEPKTFDASELGFDAVIQAAHEYHASIPNLPPLSGEALDTLGRFLHEDIGFVMHVQAFHVRPPDANNTKVRVSPTRHIRLRRRDLVELIPDPFVQAMGPLTIVPWPLADDMTMHPAEHGGVFMFEFGVPVGFQDHLTTLTGYFPTEDGLMLVPQLPNPLDAFGAPARPELALFPCVPQMLPGVAWFVMHSHPWEILPDVGVLVAPLRGIYDGALVLPFDPADPDAPGGL